MTYQGNHPLLNRMGKVKESPTTDQTVVRESIARGNEDGPWDRGNHPLLRKSPWVQNAEDNKLPTKDMTNG